MLEEGERYWFKWNAEVAKGGDYRLTSLMMFSQKVIC